jgi:hypothetical protein
VLLLTVVLLSIVRHCKGVGRHSVQGVDSLLSGWTGTEVERGEILEAIRFRWWILLCMGFLSLARRWDGLGEASVPNCAIDRHHGYPPSTPFPWGNCAIRIGPIVWEQK